MELKNILKFSFGVFVTLPFSFIVGNDILANHLTEKFEYQLPNNNLLACGGGATSGMNPAALAAKKEKKVKAKILFKKRQLSKMAAAGESTTDLESEIAELEASLLK